MEALRNSNERSPLFLPQICCDSCESWMHGPCVQISKKFSTGIDTYFCPRCRAAESASEGQSTSQNVVQHSKLLDMSDEVLLWILSFVRCQRSIGRVSSTCKKLWRIAQDPYLVKPDFMNPNALL